MRASNAPWGVVQMLRHRGAQLRVDVAGDAIEGVLRYMGRGVGAKVLVSC